MGASQDSSRHIVDRLFVELAALERTLESPLVPGELVSWLQSAEGAAGRVRPLLHERIEHEHPKLLRAIVRQDMELASRVGKMQEEAVTILARFVALETHIRRLAAAANQDEPREDRFTVHMQQLVKDGIDFIVATRTLEAALDTWQSEALLRDQGVGD